MNFASRGPSCKEEVFKLGKVRSMIIFPSPPCGLVKREPVVGDSIVSPFTDDAVGAVHGNFELFALLIATEFRVAQVPQ